MIEPKKTSDLDFFDTGELVITTAMQAAQVALESVAADWRTINYLDNRPADAAEDEEDRSKLITADQVLRELFAMRDEILRRELPPILAGIWTSVERAWNNKKAAVAGWIALLGRGDLAPLYQHFRDLALQTSPRSFIGRMNEARRRAEQRMRKRHLFSRSEKRWLRKCAQRV